MVAWQAYLKYHELMASQRLRSPQALAKMFGTSESPQITLTAGSTQTTIALIGHPYLLYDKLINHRLIHRLEQANNQVLAPEMLTMEELESATARLVGQAHWTYEHEVVGAGEHYLEGEVDGIIGVMTFGCGPDSLMMDMVRRQAARLRTTPFMCLTLEEHTAEGGIVTRLEAFLDMVCRKKRRTEVCV